MTTKPYLITCLLIVFLISLYVFTTTPGAWDYVSDHAFTVLVLAGVGWLTVAEVWDAAKIRREKQEQEEREKKLQAIDDWRKY